MILSIFLSHTVVSKCHTIKNPNIIRSEYLNPDVAISEAGDLAVSYSYSQLLHNLSYRNSCQSQFNRLHFSRG
jgi:hypothetical protein